MRGTLDDATAMAQRNRDKGFGCEMAYTLFRDKKTLEPTDDFYCLVVHAPEVESDARTLRDLFEKPIKTRRDHWQIGSCSDTARAMAQAS